jgi:hypothetical protein
LAKNSAQADKAFRALAGKLLPTAQVEAIHYRQVTALNAPVLIELQLSFDEIFTFEGREGIFSIPWRNLGTFAQRTSLEVRQSPLVIGVPQMSGWTVDLRLPKGWKVLSDSSETRVSSSCSALTRTVEVAPRRVVAATVHRSTCERITPERYVDERRFSIQADELRDASLRIQRR